MAGSVRDHDAFEPRTRESSRLGGHASGRMTDAPNTATNDHASGGEQAHTYAAVDLGSNSFHLVVARYEGGILRVLDRIKERVAIAEGLGPGGVLDDDAQARALGCLERFNQRLRPLVPGHVRILGTNAFRRIRQPSGFVRKAGTVLGRTIEIVSGHEEARLVYLGVRYDLGRFGQRMLAIDVGGGSTELAYGSGHQPELCESVALGCVTWSQKFFADETVDKDQYDHAVLAARIELEPVAGRFRRQPVDVAVGSSGTALSLSRIFAAEGWSDGSITRTALDKLKKRVLARRSISKLELAGLKDARRPVILGGATAMAGILEALGFDSIGTSEGALREGALVDLIDRTIDDDPRDHAVEAMAAHFRTDAGQAQRVGSTCATLYAAAAAAWGLAGEDRRYLSWAARLHEIGLAISHNDYHKHGAYLATHSDLSGFSRDEQLKLAALIYNHRRKLRDEQLGRTPDEVEQHLALALLLRLAVHLHRSRSGETIPTFACTVGARTLAIELPDGFLRAHPLTAADLEGEAEAWAEVGYTLRYE